MVLTKPINILRLTFALCMAVALSACESGSGDGLDENGRPVTDSPTPPSSDDLFGQVQAVFDARCTVCHSGAAAPQGLILSSGQSFDQIVGVPSAQQPSVLRIAPGLASDSYLVRKVRGDAGITGAQMPRNGPPFLSAEEINTIIAWVDAGAAPPLAEPPQEEPPQEEPPQEEPPREEPPTLPNPPSSDELFEQVQAVFDARCTVCHSGASAPQGLVLTSGQSFDQIVGVPSAQQPSVLRIAPGLVDASYLVRKVRGDSGITGAQMPRNGPPFLSAEEINTITAWVASVAAPPQGEPPLAEPPQEDPPQQDPPTLPNPPSSDELFGQVQAVFDARCTVCHSGASAPQGLVLTSDQSFDQIVGVPSAQQPSVLRIAPGLVDASYLVRKVRGDAGITGAQMPRNGPPFLSVEEINTITAWVAAGAARPPQGPPLQPQFEGDVSDFSIGKDYVFAQQSEFVASASTFEGYSSWAIIDERNDHNPLMGEGHGIDVEVSARKVYKNQLYALPDTIAQGYPIGTALVIETLVDGDVVEVAAMVKRGGSFNADHGYWEWFILDPQSGDIAIDESGNTLRGANLMDGMCSACHIGANAESGEGVDYVFKHSGDPFNNGEEFFPELPASED